MKMKLVEFFNAQERLDKKVVEIHGLAGKNLTADVTTALYVELGELAQEIGFFKYWKLNKKKDNQERQWDEWADCWHFILSLGNKYGHSDNMPAEITPDEKGILEASQIVGFNKLFSDIFGADLSVYSEYIDALACLLMIGKLIGMAEQDMHDAYFTKNRVNYERLANGY